MKAAIYCRVSTEQQALEGVSLDNQMQQCRSFCQMKEFQIIKEYSEGGMSGGSVERPAIQEIFQMLDSRRRVVDIVVIYKQDRFARNWGLWLDMVSICRKRKIRIDSVKGTIDIDTSGGRLISNIMAAVDMNELEKGAERTIEALAYRKANGLQYTHFPPYGYKHEEGELKPGTNTRIIHLVPIPSEQSVVKEIFSLRKERFSYQAIADNFNKRRIPSKKGGVWYSRTIFNIYRNSIHQ